MFVSRKTFGGVVEKKKYDKNPFMINAPKLTDTQKWFVLGYFEGKAFKPCKVDFENFSGLQYLSQSMGYHHFVADAKYTLVCSIVEK